MNGILVVNKPAGMTSFDVIARLRKKYHQKKFGHTGTLDPMASGVLVILAGSACKILPFLKDTDKEYIASIQLGTQYDTDDVTGHAEKSRPVSRDFDFASVLAGFQGALHQRVPKASAKKIEGKKLYEYLRQNQEVPEVYTDVEIYSIKPLDEEDLSFQVSCSSGTYVRSICRDFGERTGNLAAMKSLVRTRACGFSLEQAEDLEAPVHTLYPLDAVLDYPKLQAPDPKAVRNGQTIRLETEHDEVLLMENETVLALYSRKVPGKNLFECTRGLWS